MSDQPTNTPIDHPTDRPTNRENSINMQYSHTHAHTRIHKRRKRERERPNKFMTNFSRMYVEVVVAVYVRSAIIDYTFFSPLVPTKSQWKCLCNVYILLSLFDIYTLSCCLLLLVLVHMVFCYCVARFLFSLIPSTVCPFFCLAKMFRCFDVCCTFDRVA